MGDDGKGKRRGEGRRKGKAAESASPPAGKPGGLTEEEKRAALEAGRRRLSGGGQAPRRGKPLPDPAEDPDGFHADVADTVEATLGAGKGKGERKDGKAKGGASAEADDGPAAFAGGAGAIDAAIDAAPEIEECPVKALGVDGKGYLYFLSRGGYVRAYRPPELNTPNIEDLFAGRLDWLFEAFPSYDREGRPAGFSTRQVRCWLIRQANDAGFFSPERDVRGPGAWRDGETGLILHCGDMVWHKGAWHEAGLKIGRVIYPAAAPEPRPAAKAATAEDGQALASFSEAWNWLSPPAPSGRLAPVLYVGWLGCAMICGALRWRPHILITGDRGTGKSALNDLTEAVLGAGAIYKAAAPSAAGIRQGLGSSARPVMLDEVEHDGETHRAKDLVELARLGSTDGQGGVVRGSAEGRAQTWHIRTCFKFSAILHPRFKPQDASRITILDLGELAPDPEAAAAVQAGIERFAELAGGLRTRMVEGFKRYLQNLHVYRVALSGAGADSRQCDQFGALLAAYDVLTSDVPTSAERAVAMADILMPSQLVPDEADADHAQCLNHLLSTPVELTMTSGPRRRFTLGHLARLTYDEPQGQRLYVLGTYGLTIKRLNEISYLVVANNHRGLEHVFQGTRWEKGVWAQSLGRVPDCLHHRNAVRFSGSQSRAVWLPIDAVLPEREVYGVGDGDEWRDFADREDDGPSSEAGDGGPPGDDPPPAGDEGQ